MVAPGNSLWELARNRYGDGAQYQTIYQANRGQIRNPDLIYPGQVFVMPEAPRPGR
ncbi:MAG: LysM peptidoglycan-binding domain-containing protein [Pseudomonadota bacterium]